MKEFHFASWLIILFCSLLTHAPTASFAMDESGCLICHRFPGLVRFEKPDQSKVLHIDEKAFLNSPHGKLSCKKCHTTIVKVPHTGETGITCLTTQCHATDKERTMIADYPLSTFHRKEQSVITTLQDKSSCTVCHPLYPHSANNMVRALLNMHTGHVTCEVCHLKKPTFGDLTYQWNQPEATEFSGAPYGSHYDPATGKLRSPHNAISRIAVFVAESGQKRLLTKTRDAEKAIQFLSEEKTLKPDEKEKRLTYFHDDIAKKQISLACNECHSSKSILDFNNLGFDEKRSKDLMDLNLTGLVTKYKIFYFPDLFGH